jgi:hypothetical protein
VVNAQQSARAARRRGISTDGPTVTPVLAAFVNIAADGSAAKGSPATAVTRAHSRGSNQSIGEIAQRLRCFAMTAVGASRLAAP